MKIFIPYLRMNFAEKGINIPENFKSSIVQKIAEN